MKTTSTQPGSPPSNSPSPSPSRSRSLALSLSRSRSLSLSLSLSLSCTVEQYDWESASALLQQPSAVLVTFDGCARHNPSASLKPLHIWAIWALPWPPCSWRCSCSAGRLALLSGACTYSYRSSIFVGPLASRGTGLLFKPVPKRHGRVCVVP